MRLPQKCGKTLGYLHKIEQNTIVNLVFLTSVHVKCKTTSYQENIPLPTFRNKRMQIKILQKLRLLEDLFILSNCIISSKMKDFSNLSFSI